MPKEFNPPEARAAELIKTATEGVFSLVAISSGYRVKNGRVTISEGSDAGAAIIEALKATAVQQHRQVFCLAAALALDEDDTDFEDDDETFVESIVGQLFFSEEEEEEEEEEEVTVRRG